VLVLGAGLAGCSLARALGRRGRRVVVVERGTGPGSGASGNPAGLAKPYVTREPTAASDYLAAAHAHLIALLGTAGLAEAAGYRPVGALQLTGKAWAPRADYRVLDVDTASDEAGTRLSGGALAFDAGGWLNPGALCRALLADAGATVELATGAEIVEIARIAGDATTDGRGGRGGRGDQDARRGPDGDAGRPAWVLTARDGRCWHGPALVLSSGPALTATPWTAELPLEPARGQISRFALAGESSLSGRVVAGRRYAIPDGRTLWVGATFEAGDDDGGVRASDHVANRAALASVLPDVRVGAEPLSGHAGVRATTPDRMPMVGPAPDLPACRVAYADIARGSPADGFPPQPTVPGLATLGGFGARGIVAAPFAAELLADWFCGGSRLQAWAPSLLPVRFAIRALRRGVGHDAGTDVGGGG